MSWVLPYGVVGMNFNFFPNSACIPVVDGGDKLCVLAHDAMLVLLCVLDDGRPFPFAESEAGLVFFESCVHVSACFPYVDFSTFAGHFVYTCFLVVWMSFLACVCVCGACCVT